MHAQAATASREKSLQRLRREAAHCQACDLYRGATQTVFGEGPPDAALMLVGEQPGDREDRAGSPFVGPGGALLDRAPQQEGIEGSRTYCQQSVKPFKD